MTRLERLLEFYREDPDDPFTRFALASEYLKQGDTERARAFFEALRRDRPDYVGTYFHLGKLYEHLGESEEAVTTYREGIDVAARVGDYHARSELQSALLQADGVGEEGA